MTTVDKYARLATILPAVCRHETGEAHGCLRDVTHTTGRRDWWCTAHAPAEARPIHRAGCGATLAEAYAASERRAA